MQLNEFLHSEHIYVITAKNKKQKLISILEAQPYDP